MTPQDEAAAILVRLFESLARASGKTLKSSTRADIKRACELLSSAGAEYDLLDDLVRQSPGESAAMHHAGDARDDLRYMAWKQRQEER